MDSSFYSEAFSCFLSAVAIVTVAIAWHRIAKLRKRIPGGMAKVACNVMSELVGLFAISFLTFSFLPLVPEESKNILISIVFVFAGAFALVATNLFSRIAEEIGF